VFKGDFSLTRSLRKNEANHGAIQSILDIKPRINILASKLTEIVDVPSKQNLAIFGPGTIIGEEDFVSR
jgi:hypothetical protein